jgi:hypothetical protein
MDSQVDTKVSGLKRWYLRTNLHGLTTYNIIMLILAEHAQCLIHIFMYNGVMITYHTSTRNRCVIYKRLLFEEKYINTLSLLSDNSVVQ